MKTMITELTEKELETIVGGSSKVAYEYIIIGGELVRKIVYR